MLLFKKKPKYKCDGCGRDERLQNMYQVLDAMYFCDKCVENIMTIFVYTNAIKILCPHCGLNNDSICETCDLDILLETVKSV